MVHGSENWSHLGLNTSSSKLYPTPQLEIISIQSNSQIPETDVTIQVTSDLPSSLSYSATFHYGNTMDMVQRKYSFLFMNKSLKYLGSIPVKCLHEIYIYIYNYKYIFQYIILSWITNKMQNVFLNKPN